MLASAAKSGATGSDSAEASFSDSNGDSQLYATRSSRSLGQQAQATQPDTTTQSATTTRSSTLPSALQSSSIFIHSFSGDLPKDSPSNLSIIFFSFFFLKIIGNGLKTTNFDFLSDFDPDLLILTALNVIKSTIFN